MGVDDQSMFGGGSGSEEQEDQPATIVEWMEDRGYGFLELLDTRRVYVHHSSFGGGSLVVGEPCEVVVASDRMNPGKWRAASLRGTAIVPRAPGDRETSDAKRQRLDCPCAPAIISSEAVA